jgi:predicted AlkP superfamily pyrophosphatase or phosphodiesterase
MKYIYLVSLLIIQLKIVAQPKANTTNVKPKLVIGLVIDQMRWDYLHRYENRYGTGGFKRLLNNGFSCNNTFIPYAPTVTAAGHSCIYTGSTPAINGIMGNMWYSKALKRGVYCTEDSTAQSVGATTNNGKMSPANLLTTTITDELKLATNFKSKVVGVCIKDRGSILPAGHSADAAFWYDGGTGNWITSSYYMNDLPQWVKDVNNKKLPDFYFNQNWNTLYPIATYTQSTEDEKEYEGKMKNEKNTSFPHDLRQYANKNYEVLPVTPYGNSYTIYMAKQVIEHYNLGKNTVPDFLALSLSSPDYIGHKFGPNSIEIEDNYLRLDKEIADFLSYLDKTVGATNYTLFLTADHGVAHVPGFLQEHKIPSGNWDNDLMVANLNTLLAQKFNVEKLVAAESNYQLYLNDSAIKASNIDRNILVEVIVDYCEKQPGIAQCFDLKNLGSTALPEKMKMMLTNGYHKKRAGDIQIILEPGWIDGSIMVGKKVGVGTTHGLWNPYDSHIPMLWYGVGINKGNSNRTMHMTDIAPTLAALLQIQMPNGCIGDVMTEVLKKNF